MPAVTETIDAVASVTEGPYKYGFETDIEMEFAPKGLSEEIVRFISAKKNEPEWLLEWRLKAYAMWLKMEEPRWPAVKYPPIDYQDSYYYAAPKSKPGPKSLDEVDPELLKTYAKLGIPLKEQAILAGVEGAGDSPSEGGRLPIAVDAVFDSVSVATTFKHRLRRKASSSAPSPKPCKSTRSW
jgi:Fe-S cluster assembly protein SufB